MSAASLARSARVAGGLCRRVLVWWLAELANMVPDVLVRGRAHREEGALTLHILPDTEAGVLRRTDAPGEWELRLETSSQTREQVAALVQRQLDPSVTIELDPATVLQTSLDLPAAAEPSLRDVVNHQIYRLSPIPVTDTVFACRIVSRAPATARITALVSIASRALIETILDRTRNLGLVPRRVVVRSTMLDAPAGAATDILWRAAATERRGFFDLWASRATLLIAFVLGLSAALLYLFQLDRTADLLRDDIAQTRRAVAETRSQLTRLEETEASAAQLIRRARETPTMAVLNELTELVSEPGWVQRLAIRGNSVEMSGYAPRATEILARFEGNSLFANARFAAPITLAGNGRNEQYTLSFEIRTGQAP